VVAVIDRETAGRSLREVSKMPDVPDIKVVASAEEAPGQQAYGAGHRHFAEVVALCGRSGGRNLRTAIQGGVSLWNGCHTPLLSDPVLRRR